MEIGSIFEVNPLSAEAAEREGKESCVALELTETSKYAKKNIAYTASGREAIALALKSLEINHPGIAKKCLIPAYMCDSVFFPFQRAGWEIYFYHININLAAEEASLRKQLDDIRPGLLFIHCYYGMDTWKQMRSFLKECQDNDICIMEDVTQAYYLKEAGTAADYTIGSLRKWYPIPDGGFVTSNLPLPLENLPESQEFKEKRLELLKDKWDYLYGTGSRDSKRALKESYLGRNSRMESWLDEFQGISSISGVSGALLCKEKEEEVKRIRNHNYRILYEGLQGLKGFTYVFDQIFQEAVPLYFPIYAEKREELQEYLRVHDIFAPVLWPVGEDNKAFLSQTEQYIYRHLLALPMDQRYGAVHMQRIIEVMFSYQ